MKTESAVQVANNLVNGEFVAPLANEYVDVVSPTTGDVIGSCAVSSAKDVDAAVQSGHEAFKDWSRLTVKSRAAIMLRFHALMNEHAGMSRTFCSRSTTPVYVLSSGWCVCVL